MNDWIPTIGECVTWDYVPRGGWGFSIPVTAVVVGQSRARVAIIATKRTGRLARTFVRPTSLRRRELPAPEWARRPVEELVAEATGREVAA